jgi:O-acetyl-ADP-ribose deacetylase (regulator of RNase III)
MDDRLEIGNSVIKLVRGDISDLDVESFVYYARSDLKLGSGHGGAITVRGGPQIQEELDKLAPIESCQVVVSQAGNLKAKKILHVNGPKFQEENLDNKLTETIQNTLNTAENEDLRQIAFPPMGTGFYGVPLDVSAKITLGTIKKYLENGSNINEVIICLMDNREMAPFINQLKDLK